MTKEELAAKLNGREIGDEITREESAEAKRDGLIVVYGASDDLVELAGAIDEELSAYNGTIFHIGSDGQLVKAVDEDEGDDEVLAKYGVLDLVNKHILESKAVKAIWGDREGPPWSFETSIPYATFDIMEDDAVFCCGIVIALEDLK